MKIIYFICFFSAAAFAQDTIVIIPKTEMIYEDSSSYNRMNKNFVLTGTLLGMTSNLSTTGISIGKYLDRNSLIVFEVNTGRNTESYQPWFSDYYYSYDIKAQLLGLYWKNFSSNSFYYKLGVEANRVNYHYTSRALEFSDLNYERAFEGTSTNAALVIGNQWQWKNFTLGCDWIGISVPISYSVSNEISDGSTNQKEYLKRDQERYVKNTSVQGLHFYLGASF